MTTDPNPADPKGVAEAEARWVGFRATHNRFVDVKRKVEALARILEEEVALPVVMDEDRLRRRLSVAMDGAALEEAVDELLPEDLQMDPPHRAALADILGTLNDSGPDGRRVVKPGLMGTDTHVRVAVLTNSMIGASRRCPAVAWTTRPSMWSRTTTRIPEGQSKV